MILIHRLDQIQMPHQRARPFQQRLQIVQQDRAVARVPLAQAFVPPDAIGHRALAVNLSDLAAMGATKIDLVMGHYEFDAERGVKPEGLNFLIIRNKPDGTLEVVQ